MNVKVTADSTCDLSPALLARYDITLAPLTVIKDGTSYTDGLTITPQEIFSHVAAGGSLCSTAADIVVVSNEIFSDGTPYDPSTQAYIARLARLNAALAQRADAAVEVVCGIPIVQKGRERLCT